MIPRWLKIKASWLLPGKINPWLLLGKRIPNDLYWGIPTSRLMPGRPDWESLTWWEVTLETSLGNSRLLPKTLWGDGLKVWLRWGLFTWNSWSAGEFWWTPLGDRETSGECDLPWLLALRRIWTSDRLTSVYLEDPWTIFRNLEVE